MAKDFFSESAMEEVTVNEKEVKCKEETAFSVKEEPAWETQGNAAALKELYADHVVKDELVLGPELLQLKDTGNLTAYDAISSSTSETNREQQSFLAYEHVEENIGTHLVKLETNLLEFKLNKSNINEKIDRKFKVYTHVTTNTANCKPLKSNTGEFVSKIPFYLKEEVVESFPVINHESYYHDGHSVTRLITGKIDLNEQSSTEGKHHKKQEKHEVLEHSKDNSVPANQSDLNATKKTSKNKTSKKKSHAVESEKDNTCGTCKKSFVSQANLKRHKRVHAGQKNYACKLCNKQFMYKDYLKRHEQIHSKKSLYKCEYCSKQYSDRSNFNRHMRYHAGEKCFTCEVCGKQFGQKIHLESHQSSHTGNKPYSCKICLKKFNYKHRLTAHKRIHTGEKPFRCQICPKRFIAKCRLTRHENLIHAAKLLFVCDACKKQFKTKKDIRKHIKYLHIG